MGTNSWSFKFGTRKFVMTVEPENLKAMQATDFKNWSLGQRRKSAFVPFLGHGIFTTDGPEWQHSREMLRPNFHRSQVSDLPVFESHVHDLLQHIPKDGGVVDLQDLFFQLTMDSATEFLFGESTRMLAPGTTQRSASRFADAFNGAQEGAAQSSRFGWLSFFMNKPYDHHIKYVHEFADDFVEAAIARKNEIKDDPSRRYVFLDELVQRMDDKVRIRSELINILLAGRDTTASLLSNVWHLLARRKDVLDKLRAEVIDTIGQEKPTWAELKELKYLRAVLNETLRLWPVVPANSRQAVADTVLPRGGGPDGKSPMFVPKGQIVAWSVYSMHRRPDFYGADAEEFKPERWLGEKSLRPGWEYLPFNGGARICLGQQFALTEASYTCVRLLQEFKAIETTDPAPWTEWLTLTATHANGLPVTLTPA
jgi:cytochrome P450